LLGSYSNWHDNNPIPGTSDAGCSLIAAGDMSLLVNGRWQSVNCDGRFAYICESTIAQCLSN